MARNTPGSWATAAVVAVLTVLAAWALTQILPSVPPGDAPRSPVGGAPSGPSPSGPTATISPTAAASAVSTALAGCQAQVAAVEAAVAAARPGVAHWSARVQARSDKLRGRISEVRKHAIYQRTRAHGREDVARFSTAVAGVEDPPLCEDLRSLGQASVDERLPVCLRRAHVATSSLAAAKAVMGQWQDHLRQLAAYRDGDLSKARLVRSWMRTSRDAPRAISVYTRNVSELNGTPRCRV